MQGKPNFIGKANGHSRGDEREVSIDAIIAEMKPERTSGLENSATSEHAIAAGNARDIPGGNIRDGQQQATKEHTRMSVTLEVSQLGTSSVGSDTQ